jgi:hypothetical protein
MSTTNGYPIPSSQYTIFSVGFSIKIIPSDWGKVNFVPGIALT